MSRYINFYTDFAFKKIFGTEANKDLLISFLNCLLELKDGKEITDLTYMNSEQLGESAG
ncbi:MAG: PD-(D/E)XK nuclease family transposase, partial [Paludibacteraceae bacterium]|nr:PD-(D/E)XK nuclease family transposase [Paludibacteraceae bacterium]